MKKRIFLTGYMASGKTTLGRALAQHTGLTFLDLDDMIEQMAGKTVSEIFKESGEDYFRYLEREALLKTFSMDDCIIACGGGTPCHFDNMEIMNRFGTTVWLDADQQTLLNRLMPENTLRPLLCGKSETEMKKAIAEQLTFRRPFYSKANIRFDSSRLETIEEINQSAIRLIEAIRRI